jgi:hypothetical protein
MPRRISDYPDAFAGWNLISSFGSIISVVATGLFLHLVYLQLVEGKATTRYPWLTPQFYSDSLQTLLNRSYNSLEWALTSPPKPHAFVSLPLQSSFANEQLVLQVDWINLYNGFNNFIAAAVDGISAIQQGLSIPEESLGVLNTFKATPNYVDNGGDLESQFRQMGDHSHSSKWLAEAQYQVKLNQLRIKYNLPLHG